MTPAQAQAAMADAESARTRLASGLRLPSLFHDSIGAAVAVHIATAAVGIARQDDPGVVLVAAGVLVFGLVAVAQLVRFRRLNGAWVGGLASQVLLGTAGLASGLYVVAFGLATWAAVAGAGWLAAVAAVAGGVLYAWSGRRWWRRYQGAPAEHSGGGSVVVLAAAGALALVFLIVLVAYR